MYSQRKNILDIYRVHGHRLGVFRDAFERVMELRGFELTPVNGAPEIWNFRSAESGLRGRLLDVASYLDPEPVSLNTTGRAYMITRQDYTLALLFPGAPSRMRLNETRHTVVPPERMPSLPALWPREMIARVIRTRFRNTVILNEAFLLEQIGLRAPH